ncbi:hypothetical protein DL95DRAFT_489574 [Leptodontidium sp. 2 PMI_412]|nr:hypothetical protein DL95DRAFT_489574 [Leptodontidium sp. 2 PMI_412]
MYNMPETENKMRSSTSHLHPLFQIDVSVRRLQHQNSLCAPSRRFHGHLRPRKRIQGQKKDVLLSVCMAFQACEVGGDILLFDPYPGKCLVCVSMMFQCTSGSIKSWTAHISGAMSVFNSEDLLPVEGNKTLTCFKIIERMATSTLKLVGGYVSQNKAYESLPPSLEDSQTAYTLRLSRTANERHAAPIQYQQPMHPSALAQDAWKPDNESSYFSRASPIRWQYLKLAQTYKFENLKQGAEGHSSTPPRRAVSPNVCFSQTTEINESCNDPESTVRSNTASGIELRDSAEIGRNPSSGIREDSLD